MQVKIQAALILRGINRNESLGYQIKIRHLCTSVIIGQKYQLHKITKINMHCQLKTSEIQGSLTHLFK